MKITIGTEPLVESAVDLLVVPFTQFEKPDGRLPARVAAVDRAMEGALARALASGDFRGKAQQVLVLYPEDGALPARRVMLLGLGDESKLDADAYRSAAGTVVQQASSRSAKRVAMAMPTSRRVRAPAAVQALAEGAVLASYRFDAYREKPKDAPGKVESLALLADRAGDSRASRDAVRAGIVLAESQNVARDLSNQPANALPPAALAREARRVAQDVGLHARVLDVAELRKRKMGAILAVGGGSSNSPRMLVLEHNAPARGRKQGRRRPTLCFVGKGITFDSGGISIKPSAGMEEMKHDMSGGAAVIGALRACALLKVPLHVVGVVAAAENMPSGTAYRPGDVVTAMSGKTIEVLNTDAEGRVVLADALHFARTEFEPDAIVDLATLTGACVIALGNLATGIFGNDERLVEATRRAGEATAERAWPMPLWEGHGKQIRSEVADIKNTGGREAGASTAAAFLGNFVGETPWVHLDIAGTAWTSKVGPYQPRGATGVGVRLLLELARTWKPRAK